MPSWLPQSRRMARTAEREQHFRHAAPPIVAYDSKHLLRLQTRAVFCGARLHHRMTPPIVGESVETTFAVVGRAHKAFHSLNRK